MFNYIRGELYRITHKKSSYIYFSILFVLFFVLMLLIKTIADLDKENIIFVTQVIIASFSFYFIGIPVFMSVYTDDFSAKTLSSAISAGVGKLKLIISKFIVEAIYLCVVYLFGLLAFFLMYLLSTGFQIPSAEDFQTLGITTMLSFLSILGFSAISSILAFLSQRTSLAIIMYILIGSGVVHLILNLLTLLHEFFETISEWTLSGRLTSAQASQSVTKEFLLVFGIYLLVSIGVNYWILREKEIRIN